MTDSMSDTRKAVIAATMGLPHPDRAVNESSVAQPVKHPAVNGKVAGSIPARAVTEHKHEFEYRCKHCGIPLSEETKNEGLGNSSPSISHSSAKTNSNGDRDPLLEVLNRKIANKNNRDEALHEARKKVVTGDSIALIGTMMNVTSGRRKGR